MLSTARHTLATNYDILDFQTGVKLAMTVGCASAVLVAIVKADDLAPLALVDHLGDHGCSAQYLLIGLIRVAIADEKDPFERDLFTHFVRHSLNLDLVSFFNAILLASGFDDGVQWKPPCISPTSVGTGSDRHRKSGVSSTACQA